MSNYNSNPAIVMHVQTAINAAGYTPPLSADGKYGAKTRAGVVWFQGQHGLTADGIIGDATVAAVAAVGAAPTTTATDPTVRDPVGELQTEVDRLKAKQADTAATAPGGAAAAVAVVPRKVIAFHLGSAGGGPPTAAGAAGPLATTTDAAGAPAPLVTTPAAALAAPSGLKIPAWAGTAAGVVGGAAVGHLALGAVALGALVGGAAGAALDYVRHMGTHPAAGGLSTMHGEFDEDPGFDSDYGDWNLDLTAGGNPVNYTALRG
jgi:peptidoglycan hydrolase-like protein with peptidoglycan-binding domain